LDDWPILISSLLSLPLFSLPFPPFPVSLLSALLYSIDKGRKRKKYSVCDERDDCDRKWRKEISERE
jgi:hypothetical protein